ncbi:hypothetical protein K1719_021764 [Acacia pycnantha]|nr:hypothetical protein K1719_021764 [Acacia pycnantha]
MSERRISDPSKLHLKKKDLTQIRKAARVLRDPGTTSSWKSPLSSSRSVTAASAWKSNFYRGKENSVFLCNWENRKSSGNNSGAAKNDVAEEEDDGDDDEDAAATGGGNDGSSSSLLGSFEDSLSDSKRNTYLRDGRRSSIFRCRDANHLSSARRKMGSIKRKSKKINTHLDKSKFRQPETNLGRRFVNSKTSLEDSIEQSDDTEDYCNSEDLRRILGSSRLLLKLKRKNWSRSSSKLLRSSRTEDSSYTYSTPALSTCSYNRRSSGFSWPEGMRDSLLLVQEDSKNRGMCRSCYSPSLSETLRRKGSSLFCGSQSIYTRHRRSLSSSDQWRVSSRSAQGVLPLLTSSGDVRGGSSVGTGRSDDELSANLGELYLEGLSRLDGRRWSSSCRGQDGLEIVAVEGEGDEEGTLENAMSFSQKYKPISFGDLIGQNIVVQSLMNAISRDRIAPIYLFQGPRGTGKTSTARIFASALNCTAPDVNKPCGCCRNCTDLNSGKTRDFLEVDGTNKQGIDSVRYLLKRLSVGSPSASSRYSVFVIDECHLLPSKTWLAFLKFLEEPPSRVVFIFITTDLDNVPRTIQSRCQKYLFNKIKDGDIVARLRTLSAEENLDVEKDALDLIAMNADGSLQDAETMLEQLSLLGKRITISLVNELVGVVSDEKLLELLELALSSDTSETVKRAREVMDSVADPMILISQMTCLIMDIIAGSYTVIDAKPNDSYFGGRSLNESELGRLMRALKLLSEAEKQLRTSSERSTWFTATLLQLGSMPSPELTQSGSGRRQSCKTSEYDPSSASREATAPKHSSDVRYISRMSTSPASQQRPLNGNSRHQWDVSSKSDGFSSSSKPSSSPFLGDDDATPASSDDLIIGNMMLRCVNSGKLHDIWESCIGRCHSKTLKLLLHNHGKLVSICEVDGFLVVYVAFGDRDIKIRAERFLSSITNSMEMVLRCNVEVRIIHLPHGEGENLPGIMQAGSTMGSERQIKRDRANKKGSHSSFPPLLDENLQAIIDSSDFTVGRNGVRENKQEIPTQRVESIIHEQRLETAWLQVVEKRSPGSVSHARPEKNQVLPRENVICEDPLEPIDSTRFSSQRQEDDLHHEVKVMKVKHGRIIQNGQISRNGARCSMSPSLLHGSSLASKSNKNNPGYESGSGAGCCIGLLCWNNCKRRREKVKTQKVGHSTLFSDCGKSMKKEVKR